LQSLKLLKSAGYQDASLFGKRIHLLAPDVETAQTQIRSQLQQQGFHVDGIEQQPLTMENVFVHRVLQLEREGGEPR